jgi:hypothetical protein
MLVMFSMDVCDTFLYSAKILKIVKSGGKVDYPAAVYYIGFGMIPVSWYAGSSCSPPYPLGAQCRVGLTFLLGGDSLSSRFFFRLVYFPFVVMRTTAIDGLIASGYDNADGWAPFNILLLILLCLNVCARPHHPHAHAHMRLTLLLSSVFTDLVVLHHREDHVAIDHVPKPPSAR